ncbi:NUDIX domain-containing protein [Streptomyces sp. NPDC050698]
MEQREAVVAVLLRGDRLLAVRRGPAVVREVHEEVGLTVVPEAKVWESETDDHRFRLHWWTARAGTGEAVPDPREVAETRWVTPREFLALDPVFDGDREFFERILPEL